MLVIANGAPAGEAALLVAGILAMVGSALAVGALASRPKKETTRADFLEAASIVLLGVSSAFALWRIAYDHAWVFWAALVALAVRWKSHAIGCAALPGGQLHLRKA